MNVCVFLYFCVNTIAFVWLTIQSKLKKWIKKHIKFYFRELSYHFLVSSMTKSPADVTIFCFPLNLSITITKYVTVSIKGIYHYLPFCSRASTCALWIVFMRPLNCILSITEYIQYTYIHIPLHFNFIIFILACVILGKSGALKNTNLDIGSPKLSSGGGGSRSILCCSKVF